MNDRITVKDVVGHCNGNAPIVNYRADTPFGKKVLTKTQDKMAVAAAVAQRMLLDGSFSLFIPDGTSTLFVYCALRTLLLQRRQKIRLVTNNTAVQMELAVDSRADQICDEVTILPGKYDPVFNGVFPQALIPDEVEYFRKRVAQCEVCLLAVSALTSERGPAANHFQQQLVKRVVMETAPRVHVIADCDKLGNAPTKVVHALQHDKPLWDKWLSGDRGELTVTTTRPAQLTQPVAARGGVNSEERETRLANAKDEPGRRSVSYEWHSRRLWIELKDRFLELQGSADPVPDLVVSEHD